MEKISVLIVEDELLTAQNLKANLEDHPFEVIEICSSGEDALKTVRKSLPDLVLMDIQLAGAIDGIETAGQIISQYDVPIIYLSDYIDSDTVDRAKRTFPANYLSKPYRKTDLLRALEIAFMNASKRTPKRPRNKLSDRIFLRTDNQSSEMILYADILYLEAGRSYCSVVTENNTFMLSNNMRKVFNQFESPDFIKVHRGYIININQVTGIEGNLVKLGKKYTIQMSSNYREAFMERINMIK